MPSYSLPNEYPIELPFPDITPYKAGNTGVDYITTFTADAPGPHVMVSAIVHGNEPCGAIALDWLFAQEVRPVRGKLTLAFMNVAAYHAFDRQDPNASRWVDEDFNRLWSAEVLDSARTSVELQRARAVRASVAAVDVLLDIHSMQHVAPPLMMAGPLTKGRRLAEATGVPEFIVTDAGHAGGTRMRDYGGFADAQSEKNAILVECGQHWEAASGPLAIETAVRFLRATGAVAPDFGEEVCRADPPPQRHIEVTDRVTISAEHFTFAEPFTGGETLAAKGTLIGHDGETPVVTPYDDCVLIMPTKRTFRGQTAVRLGRMVSAA